MKERPTHEAENGLIEEITSYQIQGKTFIVEPVFPKEGKETLGSILLRLMTVDLSKL